VGVDFAEQGCAGVLEFVYHQSVFCGWLVAEEVRRPGGGGQAGDVDDVFDDEGDAGEAVLSGMK
jgi:hypothetical protein